MLAEKIMSRFAPWRRCGEPLAFASAAVDIRSKPVVLFWSRAGAEVIAAADSSALGTLGQPTPPAFGIFNF